MPWQHHLSPPVIKGIATEILVKPAADARASQAARRRRPAAEHAVLAAGTPAEARLPQAAGRRATKADGGNGRQRLPAWGQRRRQEVGGAAAQAPAQLAGWQARVATLVNVTAILVAALIVAVIAVLFTSNR